jgi:hypothetical protein
MLLQPVRAPPTTQIKSNTLKAGKTVTSMLTTICAPSTTYTESNQHSKIERNVIIMLLLSVLPLLSLCSLQRKRALENAKENSILLID